ncbi:MAG: DSD1 family PLP-dependent enzyme [Thaumarchaeota archaeon]|nr:DSD1 family PLP-dependent enzyme [Nitrososphaerota archaeon]
MKTSEYETPVLLLDVDALDRNIARMGAFFHGKKATLRPHVKVHKSPWLALKQIAAGAGGITCAKVSEAEVMMSGGVDDIMIANEIVGEDKVRRLVKLANLCKLTVAVDDLENARQISSFASQEGSNVHVLVDLNLSGAITGILDRTGVLPGKEAVTLAQDISKLPNLRLSGVIGYEGSLGAFPDEKSKVEGGKKALGLLVQTAEAMSASGLKVEVVSCGGTMSYKTAADFPGITEVQAGGYVFMDLGYRRSGIDFETSLTLLTRVVSRPRADKAIIDAGFKTISAESGLPGVKGRDDLEVTLLNAEHGHMRVKDPSRGPRRAERLELLPTHADTTTCLHDEYVLVRRGEVEGTVKVAARGKLQ